MENTIWSTFIQTADLLYSSRSLRFRNDYREQYLKAMDVRDGMSILEIGCGPGQLCHRLKEWLPGSSITGLDRDENFIRYAREKAIERKLNCEFTLGDATKMPFPDNSFDACTSHTVVEHIQTVPFLAEQYRVCRPGGVVSVISSRTEAAINAENWQPPTGEEQELWKRMNEASKECDAKYKVCAYPCSVPEIPRRMEEAGFINVCVDFIAVTTAPDSSQYDMAAREEFIEANRTAALEVIAAARNYVPEVWSKGEVNRLRELVNIRFDERLKTLCGGRKLWDISVSMLMIARGYKPE